MIKAGRSGLLQPTWRPTLRLRHISEQCDNYTTSHEFSGAITDQLADVHLLHDDAQRHQRVITSHAQHLRNVDVET